MANPRRRSRALRCSDAGGWPVGLPETIFRQSFCDSLARFRRFGAGGWPDGLPETSFRATPMAAMAVLSTRSGQVAKSLNSGCGWPISYCPVRSLSAAKPSHFYQGLAEWQLYQGRPAAVAVYQVLSRPASLWPFCQQWPLFQD